MGVKRPKSFESRRERGEVVGGGFIVFRRHSTSGRVSAPSNGLPFTSAASFGMWFGKACEAAKVPGRLHGLRKAGATIAANAGATPHQLMAMYGWKRLAEAERYTAQANRNLLAAVPAEQIANAIAPHLNPERPAPRNRTMKSDG